MAKFSECGSLSLLANVFGSYIPSGQLDRKPGGSCREEVRKVMALLVSAKSPRGEEDVMSGNTSAYCQARARLPIPVLEQINTHVADRMEGNIPSSSGGGLWHGRRIRVVDGTGASMPDTAANQARWPQTKSQKPGCGFPMMNLVGVFCLLTGALVKAAHGDRHTHETRLFRDLWNVLRCGDVVLAGRGFCSFGAIAGLLALGVDSLMRLPEKRIRKAIGAKLPQAENFDVIFTWKRPPSALAGWPPKSSHCCQRASPCGSCVTPLPNPAFAPAA